VTPARWRQVEELYHAASQREESQRDAFLSEACKGDEELKSEVASLLRQQSTSEGLLGWKVARPAEFSEMAELLNKIGGIATPHESELVAPVGDKTPPALPAAIGRYRILRLLGEGGMGMVYEAEQEQPRRKVALKIIKPGLTGRELLRRFEQESQALGRLQHPGIAQVYEAGTADAGCGPQPYFAMEFIRGKSLLEYCKTHELNTSQRLELMAKVSEAIHHAHQRGIIHRDLKPGNILVDERGQPKVLDFGTARVTDSDAQATRQTDAGRLVGTIAYMSPEQVLADPLELDTRSDVYALGVILYEVLAGQLPYNLNRSLAEALETIRVEDPAPLSCISRNYRGDIETIVAKALEKDKARRYASAAGLAGDIRRYLNDEAIIARPPSTTYQLRKFARRHKAMVTGMAAVFGVLIAGTVTSTREAERARRAERVALQERDRAAVAEEAATQERDRALRAERTSMAERNRALDAERQALQERNRAVTEKHRADTESRTAKAVNDFLQNDVLAQASISVQAQPETRPDPDLKVRTALDRAAARIGGKFALQPLVEASTRETIGNAYLDLGLYPDAQQQMERAFELRQRVLGEEHADSLRAMNSLASLYLIQARYTQAEPLFTRALRIRLRVRGLEHPDTLATMSDLASLYLLASRYAQAEPLYIKVLEVRHRVLGEEHPDTALSMKNLALLYLRQGKYTQAEPLFTESLAINRKVLGEEHPNTLLSMKEVAQLYWREGKYEQAEPLFTRALATNRRILGEEHPNTIFIMSNMADLYMSQGRYREAEPLFTRVLELELRVRGEDNPNTLGAMTNLGQLYMFLARYEESERLFTKALDIEHRVLGKEHPNTLGTMTSLALLYFREGKYQQSEPLFAEVLAVQRRALGKSHRITLGIMNNLAGLYLFEGRYKESEALIREALDGFETSTTPDAWLRFNSQSVLGASLAAQKRYPEAESMLVSAYEGMLQRKASIPPSDRFLITRAGNWIVQLYRDWGKQDQAAEWHEKVQATPN
jgi:eukaryotic-like serine/threonine-protein kinase